MTAPDGPPLPSERARRLVPTLFDEAARVDHEGGFPVQSIEALRQAGLLVAPLPAEHGGENLGGRSRLRELLATLAAIGRGSLPVGRIYEGHVNALQLVRQHGSAALQRRLADDVHGGHLLGVWNTEAADGVVFDAGGGDGKVRLRGAKTFASGLGHVSRALVTGRCVGEPGGVGGAGSGIDGGWRMAIVESDQGGPAVDTSFWRPLGMRSTASHRAGFEGLSIDAGAFVGAPGAYYCQPAFSGGAVRFVAVQMGGIEALFDETRRFLRQAGRTDDPHQRARLGEMAWQVESGRLWIDGMARHAAVAMPDDGDEGAARRDGNGSASGAPVDAIAAGDTGARAVAYANLARSAIESIGMRVIALADRAVGARGLLQPEPFERLHRDLAHYLRQPAPDAALAEAGRHTLADPADAASLWSRA